MRTAMRYRAREIAERPFLASPRSRPQRENAQTYSRHPGLPSLFPRMPTPLSLHNGPCNQRRSDRHPTRTYTPTFFQLTPFSRAQEAARARLSCPSSLRRPLCTNSFFSVFLSFPRFSSDTSRERGAKRGGGGKETESDHNDVGPLVIVPGDRKSEARAKAGPAQYFNVRAALFPSFIFRSRTPLFHNQRRKSHHLEWLGVACKAPRYRCEGPFTNNTKRHHAATSA